MMTLETFFEKFALFADAPDAVAKMRELVLEWAATGRLCHSDSNEWREGELGDVIELISGQHLLANEHNHQRRGIPYLTGPSDFGDKHPIPTRWTEQPKVVAQPGDILITVKGSGVGKTNVLVDQPTAISRQLMAIRVLRADPDFVHVVVKRAAEHFQNAKTGIAIPGIGRREVLGLKLVLPPLAEQQRIVAKVDELMALCDRLALQQEERETRHAALARASLARFAEAPTPANLQWIFHQSYAIPPAALRKAILTLAVQGKLVPQDPNDEPAEASSESEALFDIPSGWQWKLLGELGLCRTGKTPPTSDPTNYGLGFPFIGPGQITPSGNFIASEKTITSKGLENSTEANVSDILMVCIGGSIGKAAVCQEPFGFNQQINSVRLERDLPEFVYLTVTAQYFQEQVLANASGSATPIINKGKWEQIPIPLPPLAEQRRIVAKVDELMAWVDALETQLATARTTATALLAAAVAELTSNHFTPTH